MDPNQVTVLAAVVVLLALGVGWWLLRRALSFVWHMVLSVIATVVLALVAAQYNGIDVLGMVGIELPTVAAPAPAPAEAPAPAPTEAPAEP